MSSKRKNTPTKLAKDDGTGLERQILNTSSGCISSVTSGGTFISWEDKPDLSHLYGNGSQPHLGSIDDLDINDNNNTLDAADRDVGFDAKPIKYQRLSLDGCGSTGGGGGGSGGGKGCGSDVNAGCQSDSDIKHSISDLCPDLISNENNNNGSNHVSSNNNSNNNHKDNSSEAPFLPSTKPVLGSQRKSMESVLRRLNSRTSEMFDMDSGKVYNSVHEVLAGDGTLHDKERQISDMIAQLQNIKENLNRQKGEVSSK